MIDGTTYPETRYQLRGLPVPTTTNRQVGYVTRPYVVYRSRDQRTTDMRSHTAWEPVRSHRAQLDANETPAHGA